MRLNIRLNMRLNKGEGVWDAEGYDIGGMRRGVRVRVRVRVKVKAGLG